MGFTSCLRFKYQTFPASPLPAFPARQSVCRPVIDIRLLFDKKSTQYKVLLDSGADFCIFHAEIADLLELPVKSGKKITFFGTGGTPQDAYFHTIKIELGGWPMDLYCGFSYEMQTLPYGLLGQTGFFDRFKVIFDYSTKQIELKPK